MTQIPTASAPPAADAKPSKSAPQSGILNRPPEHLLLAAFEIIDTNAESVMTDLREIVRNELTSELDPLGDPGQPPAETGELGFAAHHDRAHLTITVAISFSGYDKLGIAAEDRPADLRPMPWDKLGETPEDTSSGDVVLQICADNVFITEHVLRRVEHSLTGRIRVVWAHTGAQRYNSRPGRTARREGRAWIGFVDGTSNLDPRHNEGDRVLTFVDPDAAATYPRTPQPGPQSPYGPNNQPQFPPDMEEHPGHEPETTRNGSYMVVRVSINNLSAWDTTSLADQEQTIGRTKQDGVSLDLVGQTGATPETAPAFASDQTNQTVPINSHIRKANPRGGPEDLLRRIFRRGYPLYEGSDGALTRGLIFVCFGRTISTQFEFIFRGWLNNPNFPRPDAQVDRLRAFDDHVLAGGYYFVPPLAKEHQPWSWLLP